MGTYSNYNQPINEAYYGKVKPLRDAERILGIFRKKYFGLTKHVNSANSDPLLYEFCEILRKQFGFKRLIITINSSILANAGTYGGGWITCEKAKIIKTKNGFKYDGTVNMLMLIYTQLIFNEEITDEEIMAVILHEIGHNFSQKTSNIVNVGKAAQTLELIAIYLYCIANGWLDVVFQCLLLTTNEGKGIMGDLYRILYKDNKACAILISALQFIINLPMGLYQTVMDLVPYINIDALINNALGMNYLLITGFVDERAADNFATIYGYGPELATALVKLENSATPIRKVVHKMPVLGWVFDMMKIPENIVWSMVDEHPTTPSRAKAQYNYLLKELDKQSPALRKAVQEDIDKMIADQEERKKNIFNLTRGDNVSNAYNYATNKILPRGDDPREYLTRKNKNWNNI